MARFKIVGLPRAEKGLQVVTADPRQSATVEAEKGETIVTTDGTSNRKQIAEIGGKKHSEGGTPLQAVDGSIIFSDTLKIKDPTILQFFNENGKKAKTFAELSKNYDVTALNEKRKDPNNDKITNRSLDKSIEDANFKLSALFAVQEFHEEKGAPEDHSRHFEPFMERMRLSYEDLFGTKDQEVPQVQGGVMRKGGVIQFDRIPIAEKGKEVVAPPYNESDAFTNRGIERLNKYLEIYGIATLKPGSPKSAVLAKIKEAQAAAVAKNPDLIFDYMTTDTEDGTKSHRPNNELQGIMKNIKNTQVKPSGPDGTYTNDDLRAMMKEGTIKKENILDAYQDDKWWYRMVNDDIVEISKQEMEELKPRLEKEGVKQGDLTYLHLGDGHYRAYKTKEDGTVVEVEADPAVADKLYQWDIKNLPAEEESKRNMDFLWSNKRSLAQARKNLNRIPYLRPLTAVPDVTYTDQAYYNPDQEINAIASMTGTQGQKVAMFAPQQQQTANFLAGQQFDLMGQVIGKYADQNVNAYNNERNVNTQIANQHASNLSQAIDLHHGRTSTLKQEFANTYEKKSNIVAANEIAAWQERSDRLNLEAATGEQFAKDPTTGIHEFVKGKPLTPDTTPTKTVADTYNDLKETLPPGTADDVIMKLAMAQHSGKYEVQETNPPVNEKNYRS